MTLQLLTHTKQSNCIHWGYRPRSWKTNTVPSPNSGNQIHLNSPTPQTSHFHPTVQTHFRVARSLFEDDTDKSIMSSHFEGTALDALNLPSWIPSNPNGFGFRSFSLRNLKPLQTYDPVSEAELNSKDFACTKATRLQSTLSNFQQLAARIEWGAASEVRLTMDSPTYQRDMPPQQATTPSQDSKTHQAIDAWYLEWKGELSCKT